MKIHKTTCVCGRSPFKSCATRGLRRDFCSLTGCKSGSFKGIVLVGERAIRDFTVTHILKKTISFTVTVMFYVHSPFQSVTLNPDTSWFN